MIHRLKAAWAAFWNAEWSPAYAVIYDHDDEGDPIEEYYEMFSSPAQAAEMFETMRGCGKHPLLTANARLVMILGDIDNYRRIR